MPRVALALLSALVLPACGGDDGSGPGPAGAITLSLSASSVTITQGGTGSVTATIGRQNGFSGPVAVVDPVTATLTIANLGADQAFFNASYRSANRTTLAYAFDQPGTSTTRTFGGFPASAGSFHLLQVLAAPNLQSYDRFRAFGVVGSVAPRTITLGPDMGTVTVTGASTTPTLRPQAVMPAAAPYHQAWSFTATQGSGTQTRTALVQATAGYVSGSPATVTLVVPDLSGASGYVVDWGLKDGVTTNWTAIAQSLTGFGTNGQFQESATLTIGGASRDIVAAAAVNRTTATRSERCRRTSRCISSPIRGFGASRILRVV